MIDGNVTISSRTKSGPGRRIVLDPLTVKVLRAVKRERAADRLAIGEGYREYDLVFCEPDGGPLHPDHFSRRFERQVVKLGLPRIRLHDLRHTWATLALADGVHPKVVQERLGHASIAITLDLYSHVLEPVASDAANRIATMILGPTA